MNAAEVIAQHNRLSEQIAYLENLRGLLPRVALPWDGMVRPGLGDTEPAAEIRPKPSYIAWESWGEPRWEWWTLEISEWRVAIPNTEAGAKSCAEAQLSADGVLLA